MALVSNGPGVSIEAKLVARRYCGVSVTCGADRRGQGDDVVVDDKLPDRFEVSRGVGNQALLGGMVLLDGLKDLDGLCGRDQSPGRPPAKTCCLRCSSRRPISSSCSGESVTISPYWSSLEYFSRPRA